MSRHQGIVKEFLETNFGEVTKLDHLSNARQIYNELLGKQRNIEHQLSVIRTEVPTKIEGAIRLADAKLAEGEALIRRKDELVEKINLALSESECMDTELGGMVLQVKEIERFVSYLQWIEHIEELSGEVQRCILCGSFNDACITFTNLVKIEETLVKEHSKCEGLMKYISDTILFWNKILKEKLAEELDIVMKKFNWPFILAPGPSNIPAAMPGSSSDKTVGKSGPGISSSTDLSADFERIFTNLLLIQLPDHLLKLQRVQMQGNLEQPHQTSDSYVLLPLQLMIKPLRKRFRYHFSGNKQTNSIAKPEWYLTQILNWVGNHRDFLEHTVQPILDSKGYQVDSLIMFTRGLLQLVHRKLSEDMNELLRNEDLFSHTIDEILLFDRELRGSHHFSPLTFKAENPLSVFMSPECIQKWINIEKACALDRLDAMLSSSKAWESQYGGDLETDNAMITDGESNESMVPECAESFITMLLTITDRYKCIPAASYQFKFLELQLHLLDDFRIRLTQVLKNESSDSPLGEKHFAVLNAAFYVTDVLREWAESTFFVELKQKKDEEEGVVTANANDVIPQSLLNLGERRSSQSLMSQDSVFESMLCLYDRLHKDGVEQIANIVFSEFEIKGWSYVSESWLTLPSKEEQLTLVVSRTACPMLLVLQERLGLISHKLCPQMFSSCWHKIADKVDSYLFQQVVLRNKFNVGGALQLQFDMTRNLFPLFSQYTQKPENRFRRMKESCILLNLQPGSAMLLNEVLTTPPEALDPAHPNHDHKACVVKPTAALNDINISLMSPEEAANILRLRIDWPQNN